MSFTAPEQPVPGQDPQSQQDPTPAAAPTTAAPPVTAPPPAVVPGSAPWANDLNAVFTDEATRGQVDQFLRDKVQPYTTQLEQKAASASDAQRLYDAFSTEPVDAYVAITEELFGPDLAQQLLGQIQQGLEQPAPPATEQQQAPQGDPRVNDMLSWVEEQRNAQYYNQQLDAIRTDAQYADINPDALHTFVAAAGGDFDQAVELYRSYAAQFGPPQSQQAAPPAEEVPATPPPNVLASDTSTVQASTTPTEPRKQTLDEAIEEFVRDSKTNPAPPVGSV